MKRRTFSLLSGTSAAAVKFGFGRAQSAKDPSLLKTTLTPFGAERAGNADGSIPAWTGGVTTLPAGLKPNDYVPDMFASEQPVLVINSSNMSQHADRLAEGVMAMMTKYGFSIKVYPTHRTQALPQWVCDNIASNVTSAKLDSNGGRFGFSGGYGGFPFPIPDVSSPLDAGAQIMWNHQLKWWGYAWHWDPESWSVSGGNVALAEKFHASYESPYYNPNGSAATYDGRLLLSIYPTFAPQNLVGQNICVWEYSSSTQEQVWELLNGQGRVRRAPEVAFDTPSNQANGICNYDEYYGYQGSPEKYDWKYLGKKEMYIPYNNNGLLASSPEVALQGHFMNPDLVRWELHRVWVVEATLHPGERNVLARRRYYMDEDTWMIAVGDQYDANDALFHHNQVFNNVRPDMPGTIYAGNVIYNLQTNDYVAPAGFYNQTKKATWINVSGFPAGAFDPQQMAASAQY